MDLLSNEFQIKKYWWSRQYNPQQQILQAIRYIKSWLWSNSFILISKRFFFQRCLLHDLWPSADKYLRIAGSGHSKKTLISDCREATSFSEVTLLIILFANIKQLLASFYSRCNLNNFEREFNSLKLTQWNRSLNFPNCFEELQSVSCHLYDFLLPFSEAPL